MTRTLAAADIARILTAHHHNNATTGPTWAPGFRVQQASPRTTRIWHDGPDETEHLDQYTALLRTRGYTVTTERKAGTRPRIRVTEPGTPSAAKDSL